MEAYPKEYVAHNLPLLALSGLDRAVDSGIDTRGNTKPQGHGARVTSSLPPLSEAKATILREEFLKVNGDSLPWKSSGPSNGGELVGCIIRTVGRVGTIWLWFD